MKRKKLAFLLVTVLLLFCVLFIVACQPPDFSNGEDDDPIETVESEDLLVSNGYFSNIGSANSKTKYLKSSVPNWTPSNGAMETSIQGVVMGIIDLEESEFNEKKTSLIEGFDDYPGIAKSTPKDSEGAFLDTNALLIGISSTIGRGSTSFKSESITIQKNTFYELNVDIYTDLIKEEGNVLSGASICLTDDVFAEFLSIDTSKEWKTYKFFIKGNNYEDRTFKVQLWLGHGPEKISEESNPYLASGIVLFDNVDLKKLEASEYSSFTEDLEVQETKYDNGNARTNMDLTFPDPGMTQYTAYEATSKYSGTTKHYYSAKKGVSPNYNFVVGNSELTTVDKENFPIYTATSSDSFPLGIFDLSKLYTFEDDVATNTYAKIYTASGGFIAPNHLDFYEKVGNEWLYSLAGGSEDKDTGREKGSSFDTNALMIYHPNYAISGAGFTSKKKLLIDKDTYYKISVWVYVWIPEMDEPIPLTGDDLSNSDKLIEYEEKKAKYDQYLEYYKSDRDVSATFRLSGGSVSNEASLEAKSTGWGKWQQLSVKIKGNELSQRQLTIEFWYGEGKWGTNTLFPGGCFFDDLSIEVYDEESLVAAGENLDDYYQLSILQAGDFEQFGLIDNSPVSQDAFTSLEKIENTLWSHEVEDSRTDSTSYAAGIIGGLNDFANSSEPSVVEGLAGLKEGPKTINVKYNNVSTPFDIFIINHIQATASKAYFEIEEEDISLNPKLEKLLLVNPNSFYRLSIWVKTANIAKGKGATVKIFAGDNKETAIAEYTGINTDEWIELTLFVQGKTIDKDRLNLKISLGSGDIFTPENHLKGGVFVTAMTWQKVAYDEYKSADTGQTNVKKATLSNSAASVTSNINNGFLNSIETSNYENKKLFDEDGNLVGEATPQSWEKTGAKTVLAKPVVKLSDNHTKITWDEVFQATYYYIFMDKFEENDTTTDGVIVARVAAPNREYDVKYNGIYYVRAVGGPDGQNNMLSLPSSSLTATKIVGGEKPEKYDGDDKDIFEVKMGIINYLHYEGFDDDLRNNLYGDPTKGEYKSTVSDNLLIISSKADTYAGWSMSSSHTVYKDKYYVVSVWVKTIGVDTKASITIKNPSSALTLKEYEDSNFEINGEFIGFVNINTNDEWVQYRILIDSALVDGRITIELFLGNRYAEEDTLEDGDKTLKYPQGFSQGTVLFDDIDVKEIASKELFNLQAYGFEDIENVESEDFLSENKTVEAYSLLENSKFTGSLYKNNYVFKVIDFKSDSFDNYTDSIDDYLGHVPGAYTHRDAKDAKSYVTPSGETNPSMLYGVYSDKQITEKVLEYINSTGYDEGEVESFLAPGTNGEGKYFLMLANIEENGQYYEMTTGLEVEASTYYMVKFSAKLLADEGKTAQFRFIYGNDTTKWSTLEITGDELKEYCFYIYNEKSDAVSSNKISFHLGTNEGLVDGAETKDFFTGILVVDDVSIVKLPFGTDTEEEFASIDESLKYVFEASEDIDDEPPVDEPEDPKKPKMDPQIWLLIASIIIGAMLLVTIVVLIVRRITKKMAKKKRVIVKKPSQMGDAATKRDGEEHGRKDLPSEDLDIFND